MSKRQRLTPYNIAESLGWNYSGDLHVECGGLFWKDVNADDYVECVRVTPVSDAGGADNVWEIVDGSVYLTRDPARRAAALECIGRYDADPASFGPYTLDMLVDACVAYWGVEANSTYIVRIGAKQEDNPNGWNPEPDVVKPANAHLMNYVKEFLS